MDIPALAETYNRDGYIGGVPILTAGEAARRARPAERGEEGRVEERLVLEREPPVDARQLSARHCDDAR